MGEPLSAGAFQRSVRLPLERVPTLGGSGFAGGRAGTSRVQPEIK